MKKEKDRKEKWKGKQNEKGSAFFMENRRKYRQGSAVKNFMAKTGKIE